MTAFDTVEHHPPDCELVAGHHEDRRAHDGE
jgi:hypothetical protein